MGQRRAGERWAGAVMVIAAFGVIIGMAHHPSGPHGGALAGMVHGAMILLLLILAWGFAMFAIERGASRSLVVAGLIAYSASLFAHIGAATINGLVVPSLANPDGPPLGHDIFRFAWESNQALAKLGVYLTGAAYLFWSIDLLLDRSITARVAGLLGILTGTLPAASLALDLLRMDVSGAFLVYAVHVAWAASIGLLIWSGAFRRCQGEDSAV
jgi:hypothetical protein